MSLIPASFLHINPIVKSFVIQPFLIFQAIGLALAEQILYEQMEGKILLFFLFSLCFSIFHNFNCFFFKKKLQEMYPAYLIIITTGVGIVISYK